MRRGLIVLLFMSLLPSPAEGVALAGAPCTPDAAPFANERPAGCRRISYRYGPLHVTPGDNLIMLGPVAIEKPREDGYVVRFKPNLERLDGSVPGIEVLHLHHAVWISTRFDHPMFASGEEKTIVSMPEGYGIPVWRRDGWLLNYMLHNQTPVPDNVFITYEIDFVPVSEPLTSVSPYWFNVMSSLGANPVYNTQRAYGGLDGECAFPRENCAASNPYGHRVPSNGLPPRNTLGDVYDPPDGTIVWMGGHVHPGGLRTELDMMRGGELRRVFTSDAVYYDPGGPISWDLSMEVTLPSYRLKVAPGDRLVLNSVYETQKASWYEGMGIVVAFFARYDAGAPNPFETGFDPDLAAVTHGHMREASNHGGAGEHALAPDATVPGRGVVMGGFQYIPGDLNSARLTVPSLTGGGSLTFANLEGAAAYHSVTACAAPCNGSTGISYPLADGPVEFDSLELGFGPPALTAAANRADYTLSTQGMTPGTYTYFCRIHPFMRGAFEVR